MKSTIDTLESVPEPIRGEYEPAADGKGFSLKLEGDHPSTASIVAQANAKVGEFRTNNIALLKQAEEQAAKLKAFDGIDPAEYAALKTKAADLEKKGVKGAEDIGHLVQAALAPVLEKLGSFEKRDAESRKALSEKTLEQALTSAAIAAGVQDSAIVDFTERGKKTFLLDGDRIVAKQSGTPVFSKKRPGEFLDVTEWASDLQSEAPHLFKATKGAGVTPGAGAGASGNVRVISNTPADFLANLVDIANRKAVVQA
jgi:hypothetical protein